jgi:hypothetical protein
MFIGIPQHIKDVESALAIRSTVRLFTDNPLFNLNGKAVNLGHVFNGVSSASVMELECKPIRCPPSLPKGAYQIIGDGPEVMDCISSAEPKNAEGLSPDFHLQINFNKILPFSCISGTMAYGPFARKGIAFRYKLLDARPCPIEPALGNFHVFRIRFRQDGLSSSAACLPVQASTPLQPSAGVA